ncbi:MAG: aminomethyltransferase family protein [Gemmataceae bacterium]|nr:aminomethyltransferase family protein [Gemmataceae bacterium]
MPERTPLHDLTASQGATFIEDAGWLVPAHFGDFGEEYRAACEHAALFDRSHHGKIEATGKETLIYLHNLCTNDVKGLPAGAGRESFLANARARTLAHGFLYRLPPEAPPTIWLDTGPGMGESVFAHLRRHLISEDVELTDRTRAYAQLHLCGPATRTILEKTLGAAVGLTDLQHEQRPFGSGTVQVRRHDLLNLPGCDLLCPAENAPRLWEALRAAGAAPAGQHAYEVLRVEAGVPVYGAEMDENRFVVEVGRTAQTISYSKGCYLGQEPIVMARDRGHVNRTLLGLLLDEGGPAPRGAKLLLDGQEVGQVTSSVVSPRLGKAVALAYVRRGHQEPGTAVEVETDTGRRRATVAQLPFM